MSKIFYRALLQAFSNGVSLRNLWKRLIFRRVDFSDNHRAFETAFLLPDPYGLRGKGEFHRFLETNRIIQDRFGYVDRLLEIGCAEGEQSKKLQLQCRSLKGVDVSARAIARARKNCPTGAFSVGDVFSINPNEGPFDLVVACEVLYYVKDTAAALDRISRLGKTCLVTYYDQYDHKLREFFAKLPDENKAAIVCGGARSHVLWWTAADAFSAGSGLT